MPQSGPNSLGLLFHTNNFFHFTSTWQLLSFLLSFHYLSLASEYNCKCIIFKTHFEDWYLTFLYEISIRCITQVLMDDESVLVLVMAWCHQAPSHYPNQVLWCLLVSSRGSELIINQSLINQCGSVYMFIINLHNILFTVWKVYLWFFWEG